MGPVRPRPWTWRDVAILYLFGSLAIVMVFIDARDIDALLGVMRPNDPSQDAPEPVLLGMLLFSAWPILAVGGLGVAVVTFRKPGDSRRRGVRGAGVLATSIFTILSIIIIIDRLFILWLKLPGLVITSAGVWGDVADHAEVAVLAAWITSGLAGRWRADADWRDRLGRWLGWALAATWAWNTFVHTQLVLS